MVYLFWTWLFQLSPILTIKEKSPPTSFDARWSGTVLDKKLATHLLAGKKRVQQ
jgi:hypothetical protein